MSRKLLQNLKLVSIFSGSLLELPGGANFTTLHTSALALVYPTAEYAAPCLGTQYCLGTSHEARSINPCMAFTDLTMQIISVVQDLYIAVPLNTLIVIVNTLHSLQECICVYMCI